ncbi:lysophospholipase L1-like esterase [Desulfosporosinus acidiphilus SJ4]|uniref:Lysophospholipase L1-like esterase n=1 Tax=Desulfosporosinus acidiphilus (strain DSM 22704 / JCM 16185 / SJ4) TaxID=646529 RepID=I4D6J4_DESAJ|nr:GDSL-type esterase/lipase family protein [Desulfosporosinus acidiphilus]AFM41418.1 lysophospholipase L1-like esterase [Desulfosporosinus acidiphilus SJ4]
MLKKTIWYSVFTIAIAGIVVLAGGFYQALKVTTENSPFRPAKVAMTQTSGSPAKSELKNTNTLQLLILGDSIAKGTGDEKGKGFSADLPQAIKTDTSKDILVTDAGINGLESQGLLGQLQNGRLNKPVAGANFILLSIGGNDLRTILSLNPQAQEDEFKIKEDSYLSNLKQALRILRSSNPNAYIVFLGLYNPYEKTTTAEEVSLWQEWNYNTELLIESDHKAIYIPSDDLMKFNLGKYLAPDGLHPNSAGYLALSDRIRKSLESVIAGT